MKRLEIIISHDLHSHVQKWLRLQGSKGKAKAQGRSVSLHPEALASLRAGSNSAAEGSEDDSLDLEISLTSELIERFNAHSTVWEGLEVRAFHYQIQAIRMWCTPMHTGGFTVVVKGLRMRTNIHLCIAEQEALSTIDVLTAFASFTETSNGQTCRPTVLPLASKAGRGALLDLRGLWHPCAVPGGGAGGCIVVNDLVMGGRCAAAMYIDILHNRITGVNDARIVELR